MTTEWKLVPVEPTEEILKAMQMRDLEVSADGYCCAGGLYEESARMVYAAMLAAAPVPPAGGEVEVLNDACNQRFTTWIDQRMGGAMPGEVVVAEYHDAHVTRLQAEVGRLKREEKNDKIAYDAVLERQNEIRAERDALKAEVENLKFLLGEKITQHDGEMLQRISVQSELTRARELAALVHQGMNGELPIGDDQDVLDFLGARASDFLGIGHSPKSLKDFLTHQSAPVAKGEHILYLDGDSIGCIPESILDRNGQVALDMCTVCGKAESELDGPCQGEQVKP